MAGFFPGGYGRMALVLAVVLIGAAPASAQWIGAPGGDGSASVPAPAPMEPAAPMSPAMPAPNFSSPAPAARPGPQVDCQSDVNALRADVETSGKAIQAASKKKASPVEVCPLFRRYATAEAKFVGYLDKNQTACGVPADAIKQIKGNHNKTLATRDKVCKVAAQAEQGGGAAPAPPPQGHLSSGLGLQNSLPSTAGTKPGGVFDTLGGNALR